MNCGRLLGSGILVGKIINPKEVVSERRLAEIILCRVARQGKRRNKKRKVSPWLEKPSFWSLTQTSKEVQSYFFFFATFFFAFFATFFLAFFFAMLESPPFKFH